LTDDGFFAVQLAQIHDDDDAGDDDAGDDDCVGATIVLTACLVASTLAAGADAQALIADDETPAALLGAPKENFGADFVVVVVVVVVVVFDSVAGEADLTDVAALSLLATVAGLLAPNENENFGVAAAGDVDVVGFAMTDGVAAVVLFGFAAVVVVVVAAAAAAGAVAVVVVGVEPDLATLPKLNENADLVGVVDAALFDVAVAIAATGVGAAAAIVVGVVVGSAGLRASAGAGAGVENERRRAAAGDAAAMAATAGTIGGAASSSSSSSSSVAASSLSSRCA
jgi:hypothetical protein